MYVSGECHGGRHPICMRDYCECECHQEEREKAQAPIEAKIVQLREETRLMEIDRLNVSRMKRALDNQKGITKAITL
jgi:hypothetical protein